MTVPHYAGAVSPGAGSEHANRLVTSLSDLGLEAWLDRRSAPAAVTARRSLVSAIATQTLLSAERTVVLLPPPELDGVYWQWPRPCPDGAAGSWFQPICPAGDVATVTGAIDSAITADLRAAIRKAHTRPAQPDPAGGDSLVREVLAYVGKPLLALDHRILALLAKLEDLYEDPDLLHALYDIDHLVTLSRHVVERFAVLGGETARQVRRPVPLWTVLRQAVAQAVAEVEHYTRVRTPPPQIQAALPGYAGPALIHLLAELVQNATRFSPRDTPVVVTAGPVPEGLRIEVLDRGLSISGEKLAALNRLLAAPAPADLPDQIRQRQIGLLVVALLAQRLGLRVALRAGDGAGTRAVVVVPSSLLVPLPTPRPLAAAASPGAWPQITMPGTSAAAAPAAAPVDRPGSSSVVAITPTRGADATAAASPAADAYAAPGDGLPRRRAPIEAHHNPAAPPPTPESAPAPPDPASTAAERGPGGRPPLPRRGQQRPAQDSAGLASSGGGSAAVGGRTSRPDPAGLAGFLNGARRGGHQDQSAGPQPEPPGKPEPPDQPRPPDQPEPPQQ